MTPVRYLPLAREELNRAAEFYEGAVPGLGDDFLDDLERTVRFLQAHPEIGAHAGRRFRRGHFARFPYSVIYVERDGEIVIVAIAHQRRRPGYWRARQ